MIYMTTGVLLKTLMETKSLNEFTHVIFDDIHERDQDSDFVMILVKKLRVQSKNGEIILMSAKCDTNLLQDYFITTAARPERPPCVEVRGREYLVDVECLDDLVEWFPHFYDRFKDLRFDKDNPVIDSSVSIDH